MQVFLTGATGFIGGHLTQRLLSDGHSVRAWVRSVAKARDRLGGEVSLIDAGGGAEALRDGVDGCDGVINLAGAPILGRWSEAGKERMIASRVDLTRDLVAAIKAAKARPSVLLSGSAVGYYGARGDEVLDESSTRGTGFLADLCRDWEAAASALAGDVRLALARIGIVLGRDGGALASMAKPAKFGLGGPLGSGEQYIPWVHVDDLVGLFLEILGDDRYSGPVNATAPEPVTSRELATALGDVLGRPSFLRVPSFALKLALGEASEALLTGQRAIPARAAELGFDFRYRQLGDALRDLLG